MRIEHDKAPGCLSAYRVSQLAAGLVASAEVRAAAEAHCERCARCAELVAAERGLVAAAALEPVPARILAAAPRARPWWRRLGWPSGVGLVTAVAMALLVARGPGSVGSGEPGAEGGVRTKGAWVLEAAVMRGDTVLFEQAPVSALGALRDGDRLKIKIRGAVGRAVVEAADPEAPGGWARVFEGPIEADGWLPLGLAVEAGTPTVLRVSVCPEVGSGCESVTHSLVVEGPP